MIPVFMVPVLNRWDLAERLITSIDVPIDRLLVIDNGLSGTQLPLVARTKAKDSRVWQPPYTGLGYGGAINFSIMQNPDVSWWFWSSNDVEFHPGHLASVVERMNETDEPRIITGGFTWAAVNRALVDTVGLVDEWSFFPIYFDDNDYHYRCKVAGVEWIEDWGNGSTHGDERHGASLTIMSDPQVHLANNRSFMHNARAYHEKWGGPPGQEKFETPWDSGLPIWVTKPDLDGRRVRQW